MSFEIKVPTLPESVTDATVSKWYKKAGEKINRDENLVDLETDKVMVEIPAPQSGVIEKILVEEGKTVTEGTLLAVIGEAGEEKEEEKEKAKKEEEKKEEEKGEAKKEEVKKEEVKKEEEKAKQEKEKEKAKKEEAKKGKEKEEAELEALSPSVRRFIADTGVDISKIKGTGKEERVTKYDVEEYLKKQETKEKTSEEERVVAETKAGTREEKRVPMSRIRARIAERLVQVQREAAILTTFNEINMQPVMELRTKYKETFEKQHGIRLGFMSFFTKAAVEALKRFPAVNASIDEKDLIYHDYYDIGIAVSSPRGLVVPIVRNAELLTMAKIEKEIKNFAVKAEEGKLTIEEMTGGTFSITNGGIFGSMLSTPIINPPQTAILGMHNIVERPIVENGEIVIRPMMYVALSYDHRVIDGRESVTFLRTIKAFVEDPARLLLQI